MWYLFSKWDYTLTSTKSKYQHRLAEFIFALTNHSIMCYHTSNRVAPLEKGGSLH